MRLSNWKFLVLALCAVIVTVVACAQKKPKSLTPTKDQAQMLSAAQQEMKVVG